ncbi:MAG: tetratricopeptide repeat protein [Desulfovibrio sp.]|jgi:tetratricopeptide (TPR) repeat protein|nr:tetratricopeptide repeat protein [Desulfovibrio sp.]
MAQQNTKKTPAQPLRGVFSTETVTTVGFGATKRRVKQAVHVFAVETSDGMIEYQPLSTQYVPLNEKHQITKEELFEKFIPAPHIYHDKVLPALAALERVVDNADRCREQDQLFTAEFEYKNALRIDENHIRASFGLGLTYLERGDAPNADIVFRKLSRLEGTFSPDYKHLFNEFGIQLRKNGMYSQALGHYAKALKLSPTDEHLLYNLARALYEKGRAVPAGKMIARALDVRPDFPEAEKFLTFLKKKAAQAKTAHAKSTPGAKSSHPAKPEGA